MSISPVLVVSILFIIIMFMWYLFLTRDDEYDIISDTWDLLHAIVSLIGTLILFLAMIIYPVKTINKSYKINEIIKGKSFISIKLDNGDIVNSDKLEVYNADSIEVLQKIQVNTYGHEYKYKYKIKVKR